MLWVKYRPNEYIPKKLYCDEYAPGQSRLIDWIKDHPNKDIPKELYYVGCRTDRDADCYTPLMIWIEHCSIKDIPKELYYDGYKGDKNKNG